LKLIQASIKLHHIDGITEDMKKDTVFPFETFVPTYHTTLL